MRVAMIRRKAEHKVPQFRLTSSSADRTRVHSKKGNL